MSSAASLGHFVWHELITTDTSGAGAFYPGVTGWKTQQWEKDPSYTLLMSESGPLGGVMSLPDVTASHWMPYISTPDLQSTLARALGLGAAVVKEATEIPETGTFAVLQDPQGAAFAVFKPAMTQSPSSGGASQDAFSWHELATSDPAAAVYFYQQLFGWGKGESHDMGEIGAYQLISHGGKDVAGIYVLPAGISDAHWLSYIRVEDVDKAAQAAKAAGGRVVNGPMEVPGGDWIAQLLDPQGAAFAVHQVIAKSAAQPSRKRERAAASKKPRATAKPKAVVKPRAVTKKKAKPAAKSAATRGRAKMPTRKKAVKKPAKKPGRIARASRVTRIAPRKTTPKAKKPKRSAARKSAGKRGAARKATKKASPRSRGRRR